MPTPAAVPTHANLEIVQGIFASFGTGDIPAVVAALSEDIEWVVSGPRGIPFAGARRGKPAVLAFFSVLGQTVGIQQFEPQEFIVQGDQVVVIGLERLRVKATGRIAENRWVMVFTLQAGRVVRYREFDDTAALAAAFHGA